MRITVSLSRSFASVARDIERLDTKPNDKELKNFGIATIRRIRTRMRSDVGPRLDTDTVQQKMRRGFPLPEHTWIMSEWFTTASHAFTYHTYGAGTKKGGVSVEVTDRMHPVAKIPACDLFWILEYGTWDGRVPARPVAGPVTKEVLSGKAASIHTLIKNVQKRVGEQWAKSS